MVRVDVSSNRHRAYLPWNGAARRYPAAASQRLATGQVWQGRRVALAWHYFSLANTG